MRMPAWAGTPARPAEAMPDPWEQEEAAASAGNMPVKIVAGRLVASVELSTIHNRIPANLFIEYDNACGLRLHDNMAAGLKAENEFGETFPITMHFPGFAITVARREQGPQGEYGEFTRLYSHEINEEPLVGTIGAKILSRYRVTFDLQEGRIELEEPDDGETDSGDEAGEGDAGPGEDVQGDGPEADLTVSITMTEDLVWLPIQLADGKVHAMSVSTMNYDSLVDKAWCSRLGFPAGDVGSLSLGEIDLARFVAFRPSELYSAHPDGAIGVVGLNLLKHLRLTIDRHGRTAVCRVTAPPDFPEEDLAFFKAMVAADADRLEAWLEKYPKERLSAEAAQLLLGYRLDQKAESGRLEKAIRMLGATWREDMVSTLALELLRDLRKKGHPMQAVFAGELGIEGGRKDRYPNSVHQLHASMGGILLEQDQDRRAWRHLLSAAFGLPDDGPINLKLGEFYEKQKRYNRALSRFIQAVITVESGEKALAGLERVQRKMGSTQPVSVDTIAPLIAGKTYNYAAATRYRPDPDKETNRVSLVEFFTNTHYKQPGREEGAIGGALGNEGIMTYFPRGKVAMLTYHLSHPRLQLDALVNPLAQSVGRFYRAPPAVHLVNGNRRFPGEGHLNDAEAIFKEGRKVILDSLKEKAGFKLELACTIKGDIIAGTLQVTDLSPAGSAASQATVQIVLAERGVLYPGKSKVVIQRMVARAGLTDSLGGVPFKPADGGMTIPFSRSLAGITRENMDFLKEIETGGAGKAQTFAAKMDPRQLTVVAHVRDGSSREILQAIQVDPALPQDQEEGASE